MCQVWRILHNYDDVQENTWFNRAANVRPTRLSNSPYNLEEIRVDKETRRNFFSIRVVRPWNNLPEHIKGAKSLNCFKRLYDAHKS